MASSSPPTVVEVILAVARAAKAAEAATQAAETAASIAAEAASAAAQASTLATAAAAMTAQLVEQEQLTEPGQDPWCQVQQTDREQLQQQQQKGHNDPHRHLNPWADVDDETEQQQIGGQQKLVGQQLVLREQEPQHPESNPWGSFVEESTAGESGATPSESRIESLGQQQLVGEQLAGREQELQQQQLPTLQRRLNSAIHAAAQPLKAKAPPKALQQQFSSGMQAAAQPLKSMPPPTVFLPSPPPVKSSAAMTSTTSASSSHFGGCVDSRNLAGLR